MASILQEKKRKILQKKKEDIFENILKAGDFHWGFDQKRLLEFLGWLRYNQPNLVRCNQLEDNLHLFIR